MNENSGNNLIPRAFPSVHVKSLGTNFACGNYNYRYFLFGLKVTITGLLTIIVILRSLTHIPTHTLALALTLTLTLQEDINLLSKGKCLESKFILFILATKKYYFVPCVDLLLEKYRVEFSVNLTWGFTLTGAYSNVLLPGLSLRVGGRGFSPDYYVRAPATFIGK